MHACVPNIGAGQRRRRLIFGGASLAAGIALALALAASDAALPLRATVVLPLYSAALGFFQFREKTWVRLASHGLRDMDAGPEAVTDTDMLNAVRRQARRVQWQSLVSAALITALYLVLS